MKTKLLFFLFLAGSIIPSLLFAQPYIQQGPKLLSNDAIGAPSRGWSVSLTGYGNGALVGGPGDNGCIGTMWYYIRTNGVWLQYSERSEVASNIHDAIRCKNIVEWYLLLSFDFLQSIDHKETHIHKIESS